MLRTNYDVHLYAIFSSPLLFPLFILKKPFKLLLKYVQFIVPPEERG